MARMRPAAFDHPRFDDHELLDSGGGQKLERFGGVSLVRPDPQAVWSRRMTGKDSAWERADLVFVRESDRGGRWEARSGAPEEVRGSDPAWSMGYCDGRFVVRPTPFKHVGVFPEQAANWEWVRGAADSLGQGARLLNLFGYTGVASVLAVLAGYEVTHVDASRTSLACSLSRARMIWPRCTSCASAERSERSVGARASTRVVTAASTSWLNVRTAWLRASSRTRLRAAGVWARSPLRRNIAARARL